MKSYFLGQILGAIHAVESGTMDGVTHELHVDPGGGATYMITVDDPVLAGSLVRAFGETMIRWATEVAPDAPEPDAASETE